MSINSVSFTSSRCWPLMVGDLGTRLSLSVYVHCGIQIVKAEVKEYL